MSCISIVSAIVIAIVARGRELPSGELARLAVIAGDMCAASAERPMMAGEAGETATALVLASVAFHESRFDAKVQRCIGQRGPAVSMFELEGPVSWDGATRAELCSNNLLATRKALKVLHRFKNAGDWPRIFSGYHTSDVNADTKAAHEMSGILVHLLNKSRVAIRWQRTGKHAVFLAGRA